jgi:tetratricopeptide (TPR) repeat protein
VGFFGWWKRVAGPEGTARALLAAYQSARASGHPKLECLLKMFSSRPGWMGLPRGFLQELANRLADEEAVVAFVIFAEGFGILKQNIRPVADGGLSPRSLAPTFTGLGNHLGEQGQLQQAEVAFGLALCLDPDWFCSAMGSLGMVQHMAGRHAEAVGNFERYFPAAKEHQERDPVALPSGAAGDHDTAEEIFHQMYEKSLRALGKG